MAKRITVSILLVIFGFAIGLFTYFKISESQFKNYLLANSLERLNFSSNVMKLMKQPNAERLEELVWYDIESSLERSYDLASKGAKLAAPASSLVDSLSRARIQTELAARSNLTEKAIAIEKALEKR